MTGASTHAQVTKLSRETSKKPRFLKKFLSLFHNWDLNPLVSHENLLYKLAAGACDWLDCEVSRQNRVAQFLKFLKIFKIKTLSKNS